MGQCLSTRVQPEWNPPTSKSSQRSRRRTSEVDVGRTPFRTVHWDRTSTQRGTTFGARPHLNALREANGNTETVERHPRSRRGKGSVASTRTKDNNHRPRENFTHQTAAKAKIHQHTRSHTSKSSLHHKQNHQTKECVICTDDRSLRRFPDRPPTEQCSHGSDACRRCLRTWIHSEFATKIWNEINCPMCAARMQYDDIREFAPKEVFHR
jgi:hypothetical protein